MIYLLAVLIPALLFGVWPAIFASLLSAVAYNFFLHRPDLHFSIARPHEVLALVIFLVIAVLISRWPGGRASRPRPRPAGAGGAAAL